MYNPVNNADYKIIYVESTPKNYFTRSQGNVGFNEASSNSYNLRSSSKNEIKQFCVENKENVSRAAQRNFNEMSYEPTQLRKSNENISATYEHTKLFDWEKKQINDVNDYATDCDYERLNLSDYDLDPEGWKYFQ
jgi:hypothetical protein